MHKVFKDLWVQLVFKVQRATQSLEPLVLLDPRDLLVLLALLDPKVFRARPVLRASKAQLVLPDLKASRVLLVQLDQRVIQSLVRRARLVQPVHRDLLALLVLKVFRVQLV